MVANIDTENVRLYLMLVTYIKFSEVVPEVVTYIKYLCCCLYKLILLEVVTSIKYV